MGGVCLQWGLRVYEQDWLDDEFDDIPALLSDVTLGRQWLMQMGSAAARNGLTIQYCMSHVRHILQASVALPGLECLAAAAAAGC